MVLGESARSSGHGCSNVRRSRRNKRRTTTQHQTLDQEAERNCIQAGNEAVVLGGNVGSVGAQVQGKALTQIEGAGQTSTGCQGGVESAR